MRLRHSSDELKRLHTRLKRHGHKPEDSYWRSLTTNFWEKLRYDRKIAEGEI